MATRLPIVMDSALSTANVALQSMLSASAGKAI